MTAYDPTNIFAKILRGEFSCYKVYEDDHTLAFLDITADDYGHVARTAHRIAAAAKQAFSADGITIGQYSEAAGGQVVFHLHMHVMPRHDNVGLLPPASRKEDPKVLEDNATKLIAALAAL